MTPAAAAKLLELPADATPDQVEARFHELRTRLEEKIGKAPTPGLKAKYRETLDEITQAFETLTLAADASSLPVLKQQTPEGGGQRTAGAAATPPREPETGNRKSRIENRKSGTEFLIVALIAVAVLGAGGWWVMQTRAEKAEAERLAAVAKAEAERLAAEARAQAAAAQAERERQAQAAREQAEQARLAAEAEKERLQKLAGQLRSQLAEMGITWDAFEREERAAERRLGELKSDLRSLRDPPAGRLAEAQALVAAQQNYYDWLSETLVKHPAKLARARAEQLLSAGQIEEAAAAVTEVRTAQGVLEEQVPVQRRALLDVDGTVIIRTHEAAEWSFEDVFGRKHAGTGSATLDQVAVGPIRVRLHLPGWADREQPLVVRAAAPVELVSPYEAHALTLTSQPAGVSVLDATGRVRGVTPFTLTGLPPGKQELILRKTGYYEQSLWLDLPEGGASAREVALEARPDGLVRPARWRTPAQLTAETRTESRNNSSRSTGLYAKDPTIDHTLMHSAEEWDFSEADATGEWQKVERRFVKNEGGTTLVSPGTIVAYRRTPEGKWKGEFVRGGPTNPAYHAAIVDYFDPTAWGFLLKCWPPENTPIGGTWQIPPADFPILGGLAKNPGDRVTGRLLAFQREEASDWVDLEFAFQFATVTKDSRSDYRGTYRVRVDLQGFLLSMTSTMDSTSTISAGIAGTLIMDSSNRTDMTFKRRDRQSAP